MATDFTVRTTQMNKCLDCDVNIPPSSENQNFCYDCAKRKKTLPLHFSGADRVKYHQNQIKNALMQPVFTKIERISEKPTRQSGLKYTCVRCEKVRRALVRPELCPTCIANWGMSILKSF